MARKNRSMILAAAAVVLLWISPALAAPHEPKGQGKPMHDMAACHEHHTQASASLDKAIALLDQARKSGNAAQKDQALEQVRQQLTETKRHMSMCMDMMKGAHGDMHGSMGHDQGMEHGKTAQVTDPVCGMKVDSKTALKSVHAGKTYYFCSKEDKEKFDKNPKGYLNKKSS